MAAPQPDINADVIVIGGGPGGSTAATMLSRQGFSVLLLERERFPREHVGESLLPASMPVLADLGVLPAVQQAGFLPKWGATMIWGRDRTPWSWYFKETNQTYPHSYQVWRPRFDQILLEHSRASGVDVREGHRVRQVIFGGNESRNGNRAVGVGFQDAAGQPRVVNTRLVVDASGQGGLVGRQLGLRRWDSFFQNLAVYGHFAGARRLPAPDENNIFIESCPQGWLWNIPLQEGWASVGAVVDRTVGQEGIQRSNARNYLLEQIAQAPAMSRMLTGAEMAGGPSVLRDWSYVCQPMVGDGYVLVGDAACFVDPLFSSGVHLALISGVLAAAYVTSALKDPGIAPAAGLVYEQLYLQEYRHFRELARLFYSSNRTAESYFWEARRILDVDQDLSPRNAFIQTVAGQPPRGYERSVLGHGTLPPSFSGRVQEVESERARRRQSFDERLALQPELIPCLEAAAQLERRPVLAGSEFQWGIVLTTRARPEGTECSDLVAVLLSRIDGRTSVADLIAALQEGSDGARQGQVKQSVLSALRILYVDGVISELKGA
jgi:flavin-dependent dehydrogenase